MKVLNTELLRETEKKDRSKSKDAKKDVAADESPAPQQGVTKKDVRKSLQKLFKEKFLNPTNEKTGKASKDVIFLRKKLRF